MIGVGKLRCFATRFRSDDAGVIAMEFTIWLPLIVLWIALSFLFFDAYRSNSRTEKVAYTVSDIMSRHEAVDQTDIDYLVGLQNKMLPPRLGNRSTRVSSICFEDGVYKVLWSYATADPGVTGIAALTDATIPQALMPMMAEQDSIILTEVRAEWSPVTRVGGLANITWVNQLVTRPRFVQIIPHETLNPATICPINVDGSTPGGS